LTRIVVTGSHNLRWLIAMKNLSGFGLITRYIPHTLGEVNSAMRKC